MSLIAHIISKIKNSIFPHTKNIRLNFYLDQRSENLPLKKSKMNFGDAPKTPTPVSPDGKAAMNSDMAISTNNPFLWTVAEVRGYFKLLNSLRQLCVM